MNLATKLSALPTNKLLTGIGVTAAWAEVMATAALSRAGYFVPDRVNDPK